MIKKIAIQEGLEDRISNNDFSFPILEGEESDSDDISWEGCRKEDLNDKDSICQENNFQLDLDYDETNEDNEVARDTNDGDDKSDGGSKDESDDSLSNDGSQVDSNDYEQYLYKSFQALCKERKIKATGRRSMLIKRLEENQ